ncbi:SH3 domain-containing protein [Candidatus Microgenomates bacterium]|nr:SH3 domain-containing protein [Candidatus Microgenomates bacterium]
MKRLTTVFLIIFLVFFLSGCNISFKPNSYSDLQISSIPQASISLDNKIVGKTPYYGEKLPSGEHVIKLIPDSANLVSWEQKIKLNPQVLTVINRVIGQTDILSAGEIISLESISDPGSSEIAIVSQPDGAKVVIDNSDVGLTPFAQKNSSIKEHEIVISFPGFTKRVIKVKTIAGYRLLINVSLAQILTQGLPSLPVEASSSATISSQLTTDNPTATTTGEIVGPQVKVLETSTGWLRVRSGPSISSPEITKVYPGEFYSYLDEQGGWVKIKLDKDKEGWVSVQYVEKRL